ncbi:hypothetical protein B0H19DRAFT_1275252 [Mycena capillaripes]|nr:hypothetical protein B0H19DRAFT_1275252 [Mycena capillaripes]
MSILPSMPVKAEHPQIVLKTSQSMREELQEATKIDPFVRIRLEGMPTFLNLYINGRSKTDSHWGLCAPDGN